MLLRNSKYKHLLYTYYLFSLAHRSIHIGTQRSASSGMIVRMLRMREKIDWRELGPSLNSAVWCCVLLVLVESCSRAKDRRAGNFLVTRHALKKVCFSSRVSDRFLAYSASRGIGVRTMHATRIRARLSAILRTFNDHRLYLRALEKHTSFQIFKSRMAILIMDKKIRELYINIHITRREFSYMYTQSWYE